MGTRARSPPIPRSRRQAALGSGAPRTPAPLTRSPSCGARRRPPQRQADVSGAPIRPPRPRLRAPHRSPRKPRLRPDLPAPPRPGAVSERADGPHRDQPEREQRLRALARSLGFELPPFPGPLIAFDPAETRSPEDPVYLGGDLHAVHPRTTAAADPGPPDATLDAATIALTDLEHEPLETTAVEGLWCIALQGGRLDAAPYLSITDSEGRRRVRILLPRARAMIGMVHLWLPSVPPAPGGPPQGGPGPGR